MLRILAVVMGETLMAGSAVVEAVGNHLAVDMRTVWAPDDVFFNLIRDRQVVSALLREVGGKRVADGNVTEKIKTQKGIIIDFLTGANHRKKVEHWVPKWLGFPAATYTERRFTTLEKWQSVSALIR
ncbi:hypothetical protein OVA03_07740 [Asticcacaulis sp. SL142]|uniref:hypothetical protein n=1 Tax=Asticcacaulis sp. SL142 TaxID=2995155 RepID=UPI00226CC02E|nr:hypothetical protein [Asticcacaulis sp. SL142]WAC49781.1 hypothetical protein OVA03_07740 [Asticcacaulis sp. SL142]